MAAHFTIKLEPAERSDIADRIKTAIQTRFPDVKSGADLVARWPQSPVKLSPLLLSLLWADPFEAIRLDQFLFLALPEVLDTTPEKLYGSLAAKYRELELAGAISSPPAASSGSPVRTTASASPARSALSPTSLAPAQKDIARPNEETENTADSEDTFPRKAPKWFRDGVLAIEGAVTEMKAIVAGLPDRITAAGAIDQAFTRMDAMMAGIPNQIREGIAAGFKEISAKITADTTSQPASSWLFAPLRNSVFLSTHMTQFLDTLEKKDPPVTIGSDLVKMITKTRSGSVYRLVKRLIDGKIFDVRRQDKVVVDSPIKRIIGLAGLPAEIALARAIEAEESRRHENIGGRIAPPARPGNGEAPEAAFATADC